MTARGASPRAASTARVRCALVTVVAAVGWFVLPAPVPAPLMMSVAAAAPAQPPTPAPSGTPPAQVPAPGTEPQAPEAVPPAAAPPQRPFAEWLQDVRADALARGIRAETVDRAFAGLVPQPIVIERDRGQAEFTLTLDAYLKRRLSTRLVRDTRRAMAKHRGLLAKVSKAYGVSPEVLAAVWSIESNLGRFAGVRPTIQALATLAWEGRRAEFFRGQLLAALQILDSGDVPPERLRGSWAGAIGQPQFMPTTYLKYARDFDGDGRRDIWNSLPDVFASIAYFLTEHGWQGGERWGREVQVPAARQADIQAAAPLRVEGCRAVREMSEPLPLERWAELGVRTQSGGALPRADRIASLVAAGSRHFLVYRNYDALLAYNCAHAYALSVGLLSDRLQ